MLENIYPKTHIFLLNILTLMEGRRATRVNEFAMNEDTKE